MTDNRQKLDELAAYLYEKETITGQGIHVDPERVSLTRAYGLRFPQTGPRRKLPGAAGLKKRSKTATPAAVRGPFLRFLRDKPWPPGQIVS